MPEPTKVPRKIVQWDISNGRMRVLADDGTLWYWTEGPERGWHQTPPLPDREEPNDA